VTSIEIDSIFINAKLHYNGIPYQIVLLRVYLEDRQLFSTLIRNCGNKLTRFSIREEENLLFDTTEKFVVDVLSHCEGLIHITIYSPNLQSTITTTGSKSSIMTAMQNLSELKLEVFKWKTPCSNDIGHFETLFDHVSQSYETLKELKIFTGVFKDINYRKFELALDKLSKGNLKRLGIGLQFMKLERDQVHDDRNIRPPHVSLDKDKKPWSTSLLKMLPKFKWLDYLKLSYVDFNFNISADLLQRAVQNLMKLKLTDNYNFNKNVFHTCFSVPMSKLDSLIVRTANIPSSSIYPIVHSYLTNLSTFIVSDFEKFSLYELVLSAHSCVHKICFKARAVAPPSRQAVQTSNEHLTPLSIIIDCLTDESEMKFNEDFARLSAIHLCGMTIQESGTIALSECCT